MLTAELKINGTLIGHLYGHNEGYNTDGSCEYSWHYYKTETGAVVKGTLSHKREDGLEELIASILRSIK